MPPPRVENTAFCETEPKASTGEKPKRQSRMRRLMKNDPNTFTFKLLQVPQQLRQVEDSKERRATLQRVIRPNSRQKPQQPLPDFLLDASSPLDFGICPNLPEEEKIRRCEEIFGQERAAAAVKQAARTSQTPHPVDLDGDCYFPQDGYDYGQHLATIGGGTFIADDVNKVTHVSPEPLAEDSEERRMLEAMDSPDMYEELADDFVADASADAEGRPIVYDDHDLLWGSRPHLLPEIVSQRLQVQASAVDDESDVASHSMDNEYQSSVSFTDTINGCSSAKQVAVAIEKSPEGTAASLCDVRAQKLAQLLEEYCDAGIGELEQEEPEESDAFSELDDIFDDFLKSRENYGKFEIPRRESALESQDGKCNIRESGAAGAGSARRLSEGSVVDSDGTHSSESSVEDLDTSVLEVDEDLTHRIHALILRQDEEGSESGEKCTDDQRAIRRRVSWLAGLVENWKVPCASKGSGSAEEKRPAPSIPDVDDSTAVDIPEVSTFRPRGELPEDRRARKAAVKAARRFVRQNKKANKLLQKEETKKAKASQARASPFDVRPGISCFKL